MSLHLSAWSPFPKIAGSIYKTLNSVFPHVQVFSTLVPSYCMELAFCYASMTTNVKNFSPEIYQSNFKNRLGYCESTLQWIDEDFIQNNASFVPKKLKEALNCIDQISTDNNPISFEIFYPWVVDDDIEEEEDD